MYDVSYSRDNYDNKSELGEPDGIRFIAWARGFILSVRYTERAFKLALSTRKSKFAALQLLRSEMCLSARRRWFQLHIVN